MIFKYNLVFVKHFFEYHYFTLRERFAWVFFLIFKEEISSSMELIAQILTAWLVLYYYSYMYTQFEDNRI